MDDKELLEYAAKACGLSDSTYAGPEHGMCIRSTLSLWNPLECSQDTFRMETQLRLEVEWGLAGVNVHGTCELFIDHDFDANKARRLAAVKAAADIGKSMP